MAMEGLSMKQANGQATRFSTWGDLLNKYPDNNGREVVQESLIRNYLVPEIIQDAEEELQIEFKTWLAGKHESCDAELKERQTPVMFAISGHDKLPGVKSTNAVPFSLKREEQLMVPHSPWGRKNLVNLPGVRDFMATQYRQDHKQALDEAKLMYFGPQNVEECWYYFNKFVKGNEIKKKIEPRQDTHPHPGRHYPAEHMRSERPNRANTRRFADNNTDNNNRNQASGN